MAFTTAEQFPGRCSSGCSPLPTACPEVEISFTISRLIKQTGANTQKSSKHSRQRRKNSQSCQSALMLIYRVRKICVCILVMPSYKFPPVLMHSVVAQYCCLFFETCPCPETAGPGHWHTAPTVQCCRHCFQSALP